MFLPPRVILLLSLVLMVVSQKCYDKNHVFDGDFPVNPPAIKTIISQTGYQTLAQNFLPQVIDTVKSVIIPDIGGEANLGIATIIWNITDSYINEFSLDSLGVILDSDADQMILTCTNAYFQIYFDWQYIQTSYPYVEDHGYGEATFTASMTVPFQLQLDPVCQVLQVFLDGLSIDAYDVQIDLHGGASWLYDLIIDLLIDLFIDDFIERLDVILEDSAEIGLNQCMQHLGPTYTQLAGTVLDFRSAADPVISDGYLSSFHSGQYSQDTHHMGHAWYQTPAELPAVLLDSFVQMFIDQAFFTSNHHQHHLLNQYAGSITVDTTPAEYQNLLSTDVLSAFFPGMAEYPGQYVRLELEATDTPLVTMQPVALYTQFTGSVLLFLEEEESPLVELDLFLGTTSQPAFYNETHSYGMFLCGYQTYNAYNMTAAVTASSVGQPSSGDLQQLAGLVVDLAVIPFLDEHDLAEEVWCLELEYMQFSVLETMYHDRCMVLAFNDESQH